MLVGEERDPDALTAVVAAGAGPPRKINASAPLVTNLENRFRLRPPRKLRRPARCSCARNHSPVFCGTSGGEVRLWTEARGVVLVSDSKVVEREGAEMKSVVN